MVSPDTIRTAIGIIGNGTALVLFLSPVPTFWRIWKKRSVEQYSPMPYVATLLNCLMWVLYPHSALVLTINGAGTAIELTYVALFLLCSAGAARRRVLLLLAGELALVAGVAAPVLTLAHTHERRNLMGYLLISISQIPNGLGVLFAAAQLILYGIYYKSTQQITEARKSKADQVVAMTEVVVHGTSNKQPTNNAAGGGHY